ncbi:MAG: chain-length determining protein [Rikenellaceae bacterium]|nr:chain-length determining protein [Rikenellaceae bacterium]
MEKEKTESKEVDLMGLVNKIWEKRRSILKFLVAALVVGLIVALSLPGEYASRVKMANEGDMGSAGTSSLASLTGMSNVAMEGLNFNLYPDIVGSTPFIIELSRIPVKGQDMDSYKLLYDYIDTDLKSPWWSKLFAIPGKVIGGILSIFKDKGAEDLGSDLNPYMLTKKQSDVLKRINDRVNIDVDSKTGIITMSAKMQDPLIAAIVADSLTVKLENYIIRYKTNKAIQDYEFTDGLFKEAEKDYYEARRKYAEFMDVNQHVIRQTALVEQIKLKNESELTFSIYSNLSRQKDMAQIKVQEQTPVITVIEPASVPVIKAGPGKLFILAAFAFLGILIPVGIIFFKETIV